MDRGWRAGLIGLLTGLVLLAGSAPALAARPAPAPASPPGVAAPEREDLARAELENLLRRAAVAYQRQDLTALEALADEQLELTVRGLGQDQSLRGRARVRAYYGPHLRELDSPRLDLGRMQMSLAGQRANLEAPFTAWAAAELLPGLTAGQTLLPVPGRLRALVERRHGQWLILRLEVILPGGSRG